MEKYFPNLKEKANSLNMLWFCVADDEVFGLAVHYYDEDDIKVSKQTNYKVSAGNVKKEASTEQPEIKKPASAPNKRKGMKKQIPSGQFLLFEDL